MNDIKNTTEFNEDTLKAFVEQDEEDIYNDEQKEEVPVYAGDVAKLQEQLNKLQAELASKTCKPTGIAKRLEDYEYEAATSVLDTLDKPITYKTLATPFCPERKEIIGKIFDTFRTHVKTDNTMLEKCDRLKVPGDITEVTVKLMLERCVDIKKIYMTYTNDDGTTISSDNELAVRIMNKKYSNFGLFEIQNGGVKKGEKCMLFSMMRNIKASITFPQANAIIADLLGNESNVEVIPVNVDYNLATCNNGIYNLKDNSFTEWDSDEYNTRYSKTAFISKLTTNYNPNATNVVIHNDEDGTDWDIESHIVSTFDDSPNCDIYVKAIWEIFNHAVRSYGESKYWFFTNSKGCQTNGGGGKSTILKIIRKLVGDNMVCSSPIEKLCDNEHFGLSSIIGKKALIADETNSTRKAIENPIPLKSLSRGEIIDVRIKNKKDVSYAFNGFAGQASNQMPKILGAATDPSVFRCFANISFEKTFDKNGTGRNYIREDYVTRKEVLEYVLLKALSLGPINYSADVIAATLPTAMQENISGVYQFMDELVEYYGENNGGNPFPEMSQVPFKMLYDMYCIYYEEEHNTKCTMSTRGADGFFNQLRSWIAKNDNNWEINEKAVTAKNCVDVKRPNVEVFKDYYPGKNWVAGTDCFGNNNGASRTLYQTTVNKTKPCMVFIGSASNTQSTQTDDSNFGTSNFGAQGEVLGGTNPYNN